MNIGEIIRDLRIEKNMSREELAKLVGVSVRAISFWENNINEPKASFVKKLAIALNVSSDIILGLEN